MSADVTSILPTPDVRTAEQDTGEGTAYERALAARWWPGRLLEYVAAGLMLAVLAIDAVATIVNIVGRATGSFTIEWVDQFGVLTLSIVAFLGGAVAYRRRQFASVDWILRRLPERAQDIAVRSADVIVVAFAAAVTYLGWLFARQNAANIDPFLHISDSWVYLPLPVGFALMTLFGLERLLRGRPRRALISVAAGVVLAVAALLVVTNPESLPLISTAAAALLMAVLTLVLLACGIPLPVAMGIGALAYSWAAGTPYNVIASDFTDGIGSFLLVVIPFFLVAGLQMSASGVSDRLVRAIRCVIGRTPGGLLQVIVVTMFIFSGISGSKIGDMAAVGKSGVRMADVEGYDREEAVAALAAGAVMGDTVPPSIGLIVMASLTSLSLATLFAAGLLPSILKGGCLLVIIWLRFRRRSRRVDGPPMPPWGERVRTIGSAVPILFVPIILIGGILSGIATPSETASVAVVVALVLVRAVYRVSNTRQMVSAAVEAAVLGGSVLLMIASASYFARLLTLAQVPQDIANWISHVDFAGRIGFLVISSVILIIMGMVMEGLPALLIFAPILFPIAVAQGISPYQFGILMVVAIGLGSNSPPIGIGLFVGAQIGKVEVRQVSKRMWSYLLALYVGFVLLIAFPDITTVVPRLLGLI